MRIISKYQDYYDSCQRWGFDNRIVYLRIEEEINAAPYAGLLPREEGDVRTKGGTLRLEPVVVVFCGDVHGGLRVTPSAAWDEYPYENKPPVRYMWSVEQFNKLALEYDLQDDLYETYNWITRKRTVEHRLDSYRRCIFHNETWQGVPHAHPVVVIEREWRGKTHVWKDASLKAREFYRRMPPMPAYQELSMWWGGQAPEHKPLVQIEDKYKQLEHGFDHPYSFRKEPTKRK